MHKLSALFCLCLSLAACRSEGLGPGDCHDLTTQQACEATPGCVVGGCPDCQGATVFQGCYGADEPHGVFCPAIACAPACDQLTDEASCAAAPGCHAIYADAMTCDCFAPGCCMEFNHCSSLPVYCSPPPSDVQCEALPPTCGGDYTVGYSTGCFEGCVKKSDCPVRGT